MHNRSLGITGGDACFPASLAIPAALLGVARCGGRITDLVTGRLSNPGRIFLAVSGHCFGAYCALLQAAAERTRARISICLPIGLIGEAR